MKEIISEQEIKSLIIMVPSLSLIHIQSFQLLLYIYDMISGMSRADVKNVLLIMHTDSVILGVFPRT